MHQNGCQFFNNKKFREWLVKMAKNAPKWISIFFYFPGMKFKNILKCTKMDVNVKKISRADVWKNTSKCTTMDIRLSKISRELLVKIPQSASKWMSIFKKKSGSGLWKWLKMHQNGYPFFKNFTGVTCQNTSKYMKMDVNLKKNPGVACENGSKCTKMDIRFSKIFQGWSPKILQNAPKWM